MESSIGQSVLVLVRAVICSSYHPYPFCCLCHHHPCRLFGSLPSHHGCCEGGGTLADGTRFRSSCFSSGGSVGGGVVADARFFIVIVFHSTAAQRYRLEQRVLLASIVGVGGGWESPICYLPNSFYSTLPTVQSVFTTYNVELYILKAWYGQQISSANLINKLQEVNYQIRKLRIS